MAIEERKHRGHRLRVDAIQDRGTAVERERRGLGVVGIHRNGHRRRGREGLENGAQALDFAFRRQGRRAGAGGFRAEVQDRRAFGDRVVRTAEGFFGAIVESTVRERVGRDVHNGHDVADHVCSNSFRME